MSSRHYNLNTESSDIILSQYTREDMEMKHEDVTHEKIVNSIENLYSDADFRRPVQGVWSDYHVPDLVEESAKIALEIKAERTDLQRAFYQCRMYRIQGYEPFIVMQKSLYESFDGRLDRMFLRLPENTPGVILIDKKRVYVKKEPEYCSME